MVLLSVYSLHTPEIAVITGVELLLRRLRADKVAAGEHDRRLAQPAQFLGDQAFERIGHGRCPHGRARANRVAQPVHLHQGIARRCAVVDGDIRHIRQTDAYRTVPIVVITTESAVEDRERAMALGASAYLVKPVQSKVVQDTVKSLLRLE